VPGFQEMKDTRKGGALQRVSAMVMLTLALSGCAGRWFETRPQANVTAPPVNSQDYLKTSTVTYLRNLCTLPREQRDLAARELNEALLPNHAAISCGRGGTPGE
jgi:hypothetical protein